VIYRKLASLIRRRSKPIAYVASGVVAGVALVISCSGGPPQSMAMTSGGGPGGGNGGNSSGGGGSGFQCTPGAPFCDGNTLWNCTRSGSDAWGQADCTASGSATNPGICGTTCPAGAAACCARSQPTCTWDVTTPFAASGNTNTPTTVSACGPPTTPPCSGGGSFVVIVSDLTVCPVGSIVLEIDRTRFKPGNLTLPAAGLTLGSGGCYAWSGTIDWISDVPSWSVQVNATCTTTGMTGITTNATLSGTI
jgi:hypothetical protein